MEMLRRDIRPRDILTPDAFENAITVDMAMAGSTNTVLHLPAIAHEAGIELNLDMFDAISERTPNLCKLSPSGHHHMEDLGLAGGIPALMNELTKQGKAVIMISSDMEELLGMSDRIIVLSEGRLAGELKRDEFSQEAVMTLASKSV